MKEYQPDPESPSLCVDGVFWSTGVPLLPRHRPSGPGVGRVHRAYLPTEGLTETLECSPGMSEPQEGTILDLVVS